MNENAVLAKILRQLPKSPNSKLIVGPGDDCAVVDVNSPTHYQLLKTDAIVSNIHFLFSDNPQDIGWKALARAISDIASMGGNPSQALITLGIGKNSNQITIPFLEKLYQGIGKCAEQFKTEIAGGEITSLPSNELFINVALTGWVEKQNLILRSGAKPGDFIFVTGVLGGSFNSNHHLHFRPRIEAGNWLAHHQIASAMMDISDGLSADLPRLAEKSQVGFYLDFAKIPCREGYNLNSALGDGEDFELLFTANSDEWISNWKANFPDLAVTCIGKILTQNDPSSQTLSGGWDHFYSTPHLNPC